MTSLYNILFYELGVVMQELVDLNSLESQQIWSAIFNVGTIFEAKILSPLKYFHIQQKMVVRNSGKNEGHE